MWSSQMYAPSYRVPIKNEDQNPPNFGGNKISIFAIQFISNLDMLYSLSRSIQSSPFAATTASSLGLNILVVALRQSADMSTHSLFTAAFRDATFG